MSIYKYNFKWCNNTENVDVKANNAALTEIRKEPKIYQAIPNDDTTLTVCVLDDGNIRNGYAGYVSEIIREHKASYRHIRVVEQGSINALNLAGRLLGEYKFKM